MLLIKLNRKSVTHMPFEFGRAITKGFSTLESSQESQSDSEETTQPTRLENKLQKLRSCYAQKLIEMKVEKIFLERKLNMEAKDYHQSAF